MYSEERIACFQDTLYYSSHELAEETNQSIQSNKVYFEHFKSEQAGIQPDSGLIIIEEMSSFDAARKYIGQGRTAVLNFANAIEPGGGVTRGAMAQEECLCRSSNLYPCLAYENVREDYYEYNIALNNKRASDRLIYTKDVVVFKDDQPIPEMLDEEKRIKVDIITCAAPFNAGRQKIDDKELKKIFRSRIENIFEAAIDNHVEVLILGAFGCGAFRNPPELVAKAFRKVITKNNYDTKIPVIVFAIKKSGNPNYKIFKDCFDHAGKVEKKGNKSKKKADYRFTSVESLQNVVNVVNDASLALNDKTRTIKDSPMSEVLLGSIGAGVGGAGSFAALYGLGTVGLSAPGIMSGLATAGSGVSALLGGAVSASVAGIFVLAIPIAALAGGGIALGSFLKNKKVREEKARLYKEALRKQQAIIEELKVENEANKDRLDYLQSLNILLTQALKDLKHDLELSGDDLPDVPGMA